MALYMSEFPFKSKLTTSSTVNWRERAKSSCPCSSLPSRFQDRRVTSEKRPSSSGSGRVSYELATTTLPGVIHGSKTTLLVSVIRLRTSGKRGVPGSAECRWAVSSRAH